MSAFQHTSAAPFPIPVVALGPGTQLDETEEALNYLPLPQGMHTYQSPQLPEAEATRPLKPARQALRNLLQVLTEQVAEWPGATVLDLSALDAANLALVNQVLGEGEVSAQVTVGDDLVRIQESVLAGVWRLRREGPGGETLSAWLEVADIPAAVRQSTGRRTAPAWPEPGAGVVNAPALLAEIADRMHRPEAHVLNLSLLPFSPEDAQHMDLALGRGGVSILSRGYGNCRITATGLARVWWVQFFNSQDALILNTLEIADVPEVARAAPEDMRDSHERLGEILDWIG